MPINADEKRRAIVGAVTQHLLANGFRDSGIRALARSAGMSDRMVMYYFSTKDELVSEVLLLLADGLAASLDAVVPESRVAESKLVAALIEAGGRDDIKPVLRLWFEIVGLAVRGEEPYKSTAALILSRWEDWLKAKLGSRASHRAPAILARIEGELMIAFIKEPADRP